MSPTYVEGLIGPEDYRSVQPMALLSSGIGHDPLNQFIGGDPWYEIALERELELQADATAGGSNAVVIMDDKALSKQRRALAPQLRWYSAMDGWPLWCWGKTAQDDAVQLRYNANTAGGLTMPFLVFGLASEGKVLSAKVPDRRSGAFSTHLPSYDSGRGLFSSR